MTALGRWLKQTNTVHCKKNAGKVIKFRRGSKF